MERLCRLYYRQALFGEVENQLSSNAFRTEQVCNKFTDIYDKIIPFFNENKILGIKSEDYLNWCKVAELVKEKKHLTKDGLDQIIKIKENMNKGRKYTSACGAAAFFFTIWPLRSFVSASKVRRRLLK